MGWLDSHGEGRYNLSTIDMAINSAITGIMTESSTESDRKRRGEGRVATLSLRSELMPLLRKSSSEWSESDNELVAWNEFTITVSAGYGYKFTGEVATADDYTKLIGLGFNPKVDANGAIVKSAGGINQVSDTPLALRMDSSVTLSKAYVVYRSIYPMCTFNRDRGYIYRSTLESSFAFLVGLRIRVNGEWVYTIPTTYDELPVLKANPATRPSLNGSMKTAYNMEEQYGFQIESGTDGIIQAVELLYLPTPVRILSGREYDLSITAIDTLLNKKVQVRSEYATINGNSYECGQELTIYPGYTITDGIVTLGYRNSDMPALLHDEICRMAAAILAASVSNTEKVNLLGGSSDKQ